MGKPAAQGQQAQLMENTASEISRAGISAETRRVLRLQTGLVQARGEVPRHRHNERQSFTSSCYVQLTKATALGKITARFTKAANVAPGLLKISSQRQASASSELFKACPRRQQQQLSGIYTQSPRLERQLEREKLNFETLASAAPT